MNLKLICEPADQSALWITDIMDGIVRESIKKTLTLSAVTDGVVRDTLYHSDEASRNLVLVVGASKSWIGATLDRLCALGAEPILVSVCQHRFRQEYSHVSFNTADAMRRLTAYLIEHGRQRIALFGLHRDTVGDIAKLSGFGAALRDAGQRLSPDDIYARGIIADCAERLYARIADYQAVVCMNDLLAIYITLYLTKRGVRVPEDIHITGFGNWSAAERFVPRITRMYTDLTALGCQAVRLYQYMQHNPQVRHGSSTLECTLLIGESTAYAPAGDEPAPPPSRAAAEARSPRYDADPDILELLGAEQLVRGTDAVDREILQKIVGGSTYGQIAEAVNVSESTIKYRLAKMLRLGGFSERRELADFICKFNLI